MSEQFFTEINHNPETIINYYDANRLKSLPLLSYFGFKGAPLGPHIFLQDRMLKELNDAYPIHYAGVVKLDPYTVYDWHTDSVRTVSLNMLLTAHTSSHSIFTSNKAGVVIETTHLNYRPHTLYLFNTQKEHMVVNTHEDRWLFTVEFQDEIFYDDMVLWIKENGYG